MNPQSDNGMPSRHAFDGISNTCHRKNQYSLIHDCHDSLDATDAFSEQTVELLQRAAENAYELGRNELDTEHLLCVLADTDVCAALLKELKLSPQDIKAYIDRHAQKETGEFEGMMRVTSRRRCADSKPGRHRRRCPCTVHARHRSICTLGALSTRLD